MTGKKISRQLFIVVEGVTEAAYFSELRNEVRNNKIRIHSPKNLDGIQEPQKFIDDAWDYYKRMIKGFRPDSVCQSGKIHKDDELWCVCDLDNKSYGDMLKMKQLAEQRGFKFIYVIPCFELWFYLHFMRDRGVLCQKLKNSGDCTGVTQEEMQVLLKEEWPKYHKAHRSENMHYLDTLQVSECIASDNARYLDNLYQKRCDDKFSMPGTNICELVEKIRSF